MVARQVVGGASVSKMLLLIMSAVVALATALPSYIAVPADQIAFVDLSDLRVRRVPRQALLPPPPPQPHFPFNPQQLQRLQQYQQPVLSPVQQQIVGAAPEPSIAATQGGAARQIPVRPPDFGEYVDFGAHTGNNGAFGWYADYPVNQQDDGDSYRK